MIYTFPPVYKRAFLKKARLLYRRDDNNIGAEHLVTHWNLLLKACNTPYLIIAGDNNLHEPSFLKVKDKLVIKYPNEHLVRSRMDIIKE